MARRLTADLIDELSDKVYSPVRKKFYKQSLAIRLELILEPEYEKISNISYIYK